jgi:transcriptional regulator with XRE-family HTH domain
MCTMAEQPKTVRAAAAHDVPLEALGRVLRRAREASGIGVREMAGRLSCSPSHVSQVERGVTSPSVHTLFSMVRELGLSLDDLLAAATSDTPALKTADIGPWPGRIVRAVDRRGIALPGGVKWEMLIPAIEDGFEFVEYVYEVGGHDGDDFFRRNGWEYGLVLEGRLGGAIGFAEFDLEVGDSIAFDSSAPHRFWNSGDVPARAVWVWHNQTGLVDSGHDHPRYATRLATEGATS